MPRLARCLLTLSLTTGCSDYTLQAAAPELGLSDDAFRWDGLVLGTEAPRTIRVSNEGRADLVVNATVFAGEPSGSFDFVEPTIRVLEPSQHLDLTVRYRPDRPGRRSSQLDLFTNDPDRSVVRLPIEGTASDPRIDVEPDRIAFGWVRPGQAATRPIRIVAEGSGTLEVSDIVLDGAVGPFMVQFPDYPPYRIQAGDALEGIVVFRPSDRRRYEGRIEVVSNAVDPVDRFADVVGNGDVDPTTNAPPVVRILEPEDGQPVLAGQRLPVLAETFDEEDDPDVLFAELRVDGARVDTATPGPDGVVALQGVVASADRSVLEVVVVDTDGETGSDTVTVDVLDPDEPITYVVSGGADPEAPFTVDDDLRIEVDGIVVFSDTNTGLDAHAPVTFEALPSSEIRIVATDVQYCKAEIDALTLHAAVGGQQPLSDARCRSACSSDPCYDPTYEGPWPSVYLDERFPILIP